MGFVELPRIMIAGLGGDSGKTFVSCGLLRYFFNKGLKVIGFKKGPDYIDSAWLKLAAKKEVRNLDTYLIPRNEIIKSFIKNSSACDISIIEGNRGLFDGFDIKGTHSTAELAKLLGCPVVLVLTVKKITRTSGALVLGCKLMDKDLNIAGVIINQVAGKRHEKIICEAIEDVTGIPVIGAIPKLNTDILPSRHLGLITPDEYEFAESAIQLSEKAINDYVDSEKLLNIANDTVLMQDYKVESDEKKCSLTVLKGEKALRIGYFCDRIFSFYYPENLESLTESGVELVKISSFEDKILPEIDALYIAGGFPETNIELLKSNKELMQSLKSAVESGLPIYAECGGLIYLGESINIDDKIYNLSGILPLKFKMSKKPIGHGYSGAIVDTNNPFFVQGTIIKSHEFHYSYIDEYDLSVKTCLKVQRGVGAIDKRDGIIYKNVFGTYLHIHSLGFRQWTEAILNQAQKYRVELCQHKKMQ